MERTDSNQSEQFRHNRFHRGGLGVEFLGCASTSSALAALALRNLVQT